MSMLQQLRRPHPPPLQRYPVPLHPTWESHAFEPKKCHYITQVSVSTALKPERLQRSSPQILMERCAEVIRLPKGRKIFKRKSENFGLKSTGCEPCSQPHKRTISASTIRWRTNAETILLPATPPTARSLIGVLCD